MFTELNGIPNYAQAARFTRQIMRDDRKSPQDRFNTLQHWLMNHFGMTRDQAFSFIMGYITPEIGSL